MHRATCFDFVAHQANHVRRWSDELDVASLADLSEVSRLGEKPVARMNRIDVEDLRGADDGGNVEIALRGRRWSNARCFVGETDVQRIAIDVAVNGDRLDAHLLASPDNATGNLAAIGDQDFLELAWIKSHEIRATKKHKMHKLILVLFVLLWLNFEYRREAGRIQPAGRSQRKS